MDRAITLKRIDGRIKVSSFKTAQFLEKAHEFHGTWKEPYWWFDDTYTDLVKDVLLKEWNIDAERPYQECTLYVRKFNASVEQGPVYLFNRMIAESYGHGFRSKLGADVNLIFGRYKVGGTFKHWTTDVVDATFELNRFPKPAILLPAVTAAIVEGWCVVRTEDGARTRDIVQADLEVCEFKLNRIQRELRIFDGVKSKYLG